MKKTKGRKWLVNIPIGNELAGDHRFRTKGEANVFAYEYKGLYGVVLFVEKAW